MAPTAKFCSGCIKVLSPATAKTEEGKAFLNAHYFTPGNQPDYTKGPKTEEGRCDRCGKQGIVTYYVL